jgi:cysteine sulfinate desulfinase/cysteine desulfurase-like protein
VRSRWCRNSATSGAGTHEQRHHSQVARLIGAQPQEMVFTGSGSEADNLAICGVALANPGRDGTPAEVDVVTQRTAHRAVLAACDALHRLHGGQVTHLPVDTCGQVDPTTLSAALGDRGTDYTTIYGGGQEHGLRAGTENVALALGTAADPAAADLATGEPDRLRGLRDELHRRLAEHLPGRTVLNGHPTQRLPNTLNLSLTPYDSVGLLAAAAGVAASTGSACHTGTTQPSPVLTAMALPDTRTRCAVRLSLGRWTTTDDITEAADRLACVATSRAEG